MLLSILPTHKLDLPVEPILATHESELISLTSELHEWGVIVFSMSLCLASVPTKGLQLLTLRGGAIDFLM